MLLILAGVSIATLTGDNGLLTRAEKAREESEKTAIIEQIQLDIADKQIENLGSIDEDEFYKILGKYGTVSADETILTTTNGNYKILISDIYSGNISAVTRQSNNLINKENLKYGITTYQGNESENLSFMSTDKIEIEGNTRYLTNRNVQTINYYNAEQEYISQENGGAYTYIASGFTTPQEAKYVVISYRVTNADGTDEKYNDFAEEIWLGKIDNYNNIVYEEYGEVNYKEGINNIIEQGRIFYNTYIYERDTRLITTYQENKCFTIIKPIENQSFSITGMQRIDDFYYLDENLNIVRRETYPSDNYISLNKNTDPDAYYLLILFSSSKDDNIVMKYDEPVSNNILQGKNIVGYGDSLTERTSYTNTTWLGKVANYFSMKQYNRGIGGTAVTESTSTAWVTPEGELLANEIAGDSEPTEEHITINSSMSHDERIATIPTNADIVLFFGGTNGMDEESYRTTLDKIKTRAPNAKIICMNITYRQTEDEDESIAEDYANRRNIITQIADEYGYPVIQLKELMGVNSSNASQYMSDKVHFNDAGKVKIATAVINQLKQSIQDGYIK